MFKGTPKSHKPPSAVTLGNDAPKAMVETSGVQSCLCVTSPESPCAEGKSWWRINQVDQDHNCNYIIILVYHCHHRY